MPQPDDRRIAIASRTLRRKSGFKQTDVVPRGRSRRLVLDLEAGRAGALRIDDLRRYFEQFGAIVRLTVSWNGAALDRTVDEQHAGIGESAIGVLLRYRWLTLSELTFSEYGERGSIDVFGTREAEASVFVGEVKSEWGSLEETNRSLDIKARLAPKLCFDRFGWRPRYVAKVLILPDNGGARRIAARYGQTLASVYPARSREVRRWIQKPSGPLAGIWFLSSITPS